MAKKNQGIYVMSDEEYEEMLKQEAAKELKKDRSSFMDRLSLATAKKSKTFSAKRYHTSESSNTTKKSDPELSMDTPELQLPEKMANLDDEDWDKMMEAFDDLSPIDDITQTERERYRRRSSGDKFDDMFKKEQSMLSEVLKDLQTRSKIINQYVKEFGGKKSVRGISKTFAEILETGNATDTAKMNVISKMVDVKKTIQDMRLKEQKARPEEDESVDSMADKFYRSIMSGSVQNFMQSSISRYSVAPNSFREDEEQGKVPEFNITQPTAIGYSKEDYQKVAATSDPYGYIRNEALEVQPYVYRYPDNSLEFVALDKDMNEVYDYELPDISLLETLSIKPGASFGYDEYGRRYKIIDVDEMPAEEPEEEYEDDIPPDDKYTYGGDDEEE